MSCYATILGRYLLARGSLGETNGGAYSRGTVRAGRSVSVTVAA